MHFLRSLNHLSFKNGDLIWNFQQNDLLKNSSESSQSPVDRRQITIGKLLFQLHPCDHRLDRPDQTGRIAEHAQQTEQANVWALNVAEKADQVRSGQRCESTEECRQSERKTGPIFAQIFAKTNIDQDHDHSGQNAQQQRDHQQTVVVVEEVQQVEQDGDHQIATEEVQLVRDQLLVD